MKIVLVGCGKVGVTLVANLVKEGHDVTIIDNNPAIIEEVTNVHDVMGVCGNGAEVGTLEEAGVENAELFIAVTGSDELNMLSCFMAKKKGAQHTIARVRNPEYEPNIAFMKQQLGISLIINPELLAAQEYFNILQLPSAMKIETFSRRNFEMIELLLKEDSPLIGETLADIRKKYKASFLVCVVQRDKEVFIPGGNFTLKLGDRVGVTATSTEIQKLLRMLGIMQKQAKHVMILGASRSAYYLTKSLLAAGTDVKLIEKNPQIASEMCEVLSDAVVIQGDGSDHEVLLEEGVRSMDAFVALTGIDEENILISFFAQNQGVKKAIAKVNRNSLEEISKDFGIDCVISPKKLTADVVLRYVRARQNSRGSKVETLYKLMDEKAEALEFVVQADFKHCQIPLKEMDLKPNTLIAGIIRGKKIIIPSGEDMILPGDHVVVISTPQLMNDLSDIIR